MNKIQHVKIIIFHSFPAESSDALFYLLKIKIFIDDIDLALQNSSVKFCAFFGLQKSWWDHGIIESVNQSIDHTLTGLDSRRRASLNFDWIRCWVMVSVCVFQK